MDQPGLIIIKEVILEEIITILLICLRGLYSVSIFYEVMGFSRSAVQHGYAASINCQEERQS